MRFECARLDSTRTITQNTSVEVRGFLNLVFSKLIPVFGGGIVSGYATRRESYHGGLEAMPAICMALSKGEYFESPVSRSLFLGNWYDRSLIQDDPTACIAF